MADTASHAALMDRVYGRQRHIYDLTRKYYLLGRDRLIGELDPPAGGAVLEIGCGTGRNLIAAARRYPGVRFHGFDLSAKMLETADANIRRAGLEDVIHIARADAATADYGKLFAGTRFDRVFVSYSLSMIPEWPRVLANAAHALAPGGALHVADFGAQENLPRWFQGLLKTWLALFHVRPRPTLHEELALLAGTHRGQLRHSSLYGGYACHGVLKLPA